MGAEKDRGLRMSKFLGYIKPRKILGENGYTFSNLGRNFILTKGEFSVTVAMDLYSGVFLNHWIAESGAPGVLPFEAGFDQSDPGGKIGQLCALSPLLQRENKGLTPYELDVVAVEVFVSENIVFRIGGIDELKTAYILPGFAQAGDFADATLLGSRSFYVAFDVGFLRLPEAWVQLIVEKGWSWNLQEGVVYLSNSESARYGLPPSYYQLGLSSLDLSYPVGGGVPVAVVLAPREAPAITGDAWEVAIAKFFAEPSPHTLAAMMGSACAQTDYQVMKKCPEYSPGTNRSKLTTALVDEMSAYGQNATAADLAKALEEVTASVPGNRRKAQFILLKKLNSQMKVDALSGTLRFVK